MEASNEELVDELMRRFDDGVLLMESRLEPHRTLRLLRTWGNSVWGVGAGRVLADESEGTFAQELERLAQQQQEKDEEEDGNEET